MQIPQEIREKLDAHPWEVVGIAALVGAFVGFAPLRPRREQSGVKRWIADALLSAVSAVAVRYVREVGMNRLGDLARQWWDEHSHAGAGPEQDASEVGANGKTEARGEDRSRNRA